MLLTREIRTEALNGAERSILPFIVDCVVVSALWYFQNESLAQESRDHYRDVKPLILQAVIKRRSEAYLHKDLPPAKITHNDDAKWLELWFSGMHHI